MEMKENEENGSDKAEAKEEKPVTPQWSDQMARMDRALAKFKPGPFLKSDETIEMQLIRDEGVTLIEAFSPCHNSNIQLAKIVGTGENGSEAKFAAVFSKAFKLKSLLERTVLELKEQRFTQETFDEMNLLLNSIKIAERNIPKFEAPILKESTVNELEGSKIV